MNRLMKSVRRRGILGTLLYSVQRLTPEFRRKARRRLLEEEETRRKAAFEFDRAHGVDTGGVIDIGQLQIASENKFFGTRYEAVLPLEFHNMMDTAGNVAAGRVFIDIGCGKGRAMLLACEYPFRRVVGVEFAPQLVEVARRNLSAFRSERQECYDFELVLSDAAEYQIPDDPLVVFLFNPFGPIVMKRLIENLRRSFNRVPRPLTILYAHPKHLDLLRELPMIRSVSLQRTSDAHNPGYSEYAVIQIGNGLGESPRA